MPVINIGVRNKIASTTAHIVCDNKDYTAVFDFDSEWDDYETKTARFVWNGQHEDVVFSGSECAVPRITDTSLCEVGVFAGDLHTTTSAKVWCLRSILQNSGTPAAPTEDVYSQIMELLNEAGSIDPETVAAAVSEYLTANPVEAPVTSVNGKTGEVSLLAGDVEAMRGKVVSNWDSGNDGDDVYEIIFNYDVGVVKKVPAAVFGDNNSAPVLVLVGERSYNYKDFTAIDRHGRTWYGTCKLTDPSISTFYVEYPTPEEIGAATPEDVAEAKTLGITGAEVGQIATVAAVDDDGVPTAWEVGDMPTGGGSESEIAIISGTATSYSNHELTSIRQYAFYAYSALETVDLPKVEYTGYQAFADSGLTSVSLPALVTSGSHVFMGCSKLVRAEFDALINISAAMFNNCAALTTLILRTSTVVKLGHANSLVKTPIADGSGYVYVPDDLVSDYMAASSWSTYQAQIRPLSDLKEQEDNT